MNKYWWLNEESSDMLERGYLVKGQSVEEKLDLICGHASKILKKPELKNKFKEVFEMGWASLSSPIWANFGQGRALPISCITGDTWVNTHNGGKMAKDIKIGDLVLTHKNRFKSVTAIIPTKDKGDIWKLKVGTRMTNLYITGNHPVLTNLGWVNVENLDTKKHLIAVNGELNYTSSDYIIDLKPFVDYKYILKEGNICKAVENTSEKSKKLNLKSDYITYYSTPKEFINITEDIAWALGVWFAEGSLTISNKKEPNGIRITVNDKDENWVAEEWLQIMTKSFNLKGNIYKSEVTRKGKLNSWLTVNFNGKVVGNLFKSFGKGAKEKEVPDWVINLPKNKLQKFLDGILLGDGSKGKNGSNKITLANPKLLLQVYNMGLKLGHDMSLQMQEKAGVLATTSHVYTINFRGYETSLNKHSASSGVRFNDGLIYCPIKILEKTNKVEDVYDFTVDEDHSFSCAGVIVHNCFSSYVPDSLNGIYSSLKEVAIMTQQGGGTAGYFNLRPTGAEVTGGATSSGAMSFISLFDSTIEVVKQNNVRRGAFAAYMEIDHPEIKDFLEIKDKGHRMQTLNTAVNVSDAWMESMIAGDKEKRDIWALVLKSRREKGIPYINFTDNINKNKPQVYKDKNLTIWQSNLCNEIMLPTSEEESLVCCLLSMNAYTYDEWKDTDAIELMVYFLDAVMEDFIIKAEKVQGMERALRFAKNHRALGIGILGYASYLQKNMIAFESFEAQQFNTRLFKDLQVKAINASIKLASEYGEPELLKGYGMRNTTLIALAPTTSSSSILGQVSPSIEPLKSNYFVVGLAKGSFARKNKELEILLEVKNKNTEDVWKTILTNKGSVQNLGFLSEKEKSVFKTFEEISPLTIIQQASARQPFICQGQSLNLLIPNEVEIKQINAWMIEAWKLGIKGLYYQRGTSIAKDAVLKMLECQSCEA